MRVWTLTALEDLTKDGTALPRALRLAGTSILQWTSTQIGG